MTPLLEARGLTVEFGGVCALADADLTVRAGQLCGVIGPNGAGKTTFIDAVCGFVPARGTVVFDDIDVGPLPPYRRARLGLARTFQSVELFDDLDVLGNLEVAVAGSGWRDVARDLVHPTPRRAPSADVDHAITLLGLGPVLRRHPRELPPAVRRMVGIGRALATTPKLVFLDEPAAGLDPAESRELAARLLAIRSSGVTIVLVDHDTELVFGCCDPIHVFDRGVVIASGPSEDIRTNDVVVAAYLGNAKAARSVVA